ncbi:MAG: phosphoglycerate dehydrogenase [Methylacidiphilales bacterium]|nr:phosphoglycerate dehydrogenase [Candidatus Methylacidiphilales bacterium]
MSQYRVLVLDGVSPRGVEVLAGVQGVEVIQSKSLSEDELVQKIPDFDALVVRSQTKVTKKALEAAKKLKVVGRAGVGVDNVDVPTATQKGIVVMNTPGGNTISTAEHAFSLLLSMARSIPQAHATMKAGKWDRKSFEGVEINNKVLGIIGMGRIGTEVCRRAMAFGMKVLAYDPYLSLGKARSLQVELYEKLDEMLPHCDFITLHIPMSAETKGILNERTLKLCKKGVRIVNCARGGLVEEKALHEALLSGQVAGAALDVYEKEPPAAEFPLRDVPTLVMTPHLGASTAEAQESVGIEVAEAIRDLLLTGTIRNAVNMPNVDSKTLELLRPYLELGEKLGRILAQLAPTRCEMLTVNYSGKITEFDTTAISRAVVKGFLKLAIGPDVNDVNAPFYAENLGLKYSETRLSQAGEYSEMLTAQVSTGSGEVFEVSGTIFGVAPRLVSINKHYLEARPEGVLLVMENTDRPGIVGWVGTLLGKHKVNIASMSLSRSAPGSKALSVLNLDSMPSPAVIQELTKDPDITSVKFIQV